MLTLTAIYLLLVLFVYLAIEVFQKVAQERKNDVLIANNIRRYQYIKINNEWKA